MFSQIGFKLISEHDVLKVWKDNLFVPLVNILPRNLTPNLITLFRFLIVLIWLPFAIFQPRPAQLIIFFIVYFFDLLDGAVARLRNQVTFFGEKFDALSDRLNHIALYLIIGHWFRGELLTLKLFIFFEFFFIVIIVGEYFFKNSQFNYSRTFFQFCVKVGLWLALIYEVIVVYG